jgi:glycolate oxidase
LINKEIVSRLREIVGSKAVLTAKEDLTAYSYDSTRFWQHKPDLVVLPTTTGQISQILKIANENLIPVTPRGAGTNMSGGSIPINGGIVLCTTMMNRILEINKVNLTAVVEPGVVLEEFKLTLAKQGLFYPPDPQSSFGCTIGGNVAENAGGPLCLKYGVTRKYVLGLEVVLADGEIVDLGSATFKNRTGYDLTMLFTGSEGTLGVITKIILGLLPMPPASQTIYTVFPDMISASEAVTSILATGIIPSRMELLSSPVLKTAAPPPNRAGPPPVEGVVVLLESDGHPAAVASESERILDICRRMGAKEAKMARDDAEAAKYWELRRAGFAKSGETGLTGLSEDVTVPRDKFTPFIRKCQEISRQYDVTLTVSGHLGDGNMHPGVLADINNKDQFERAKKAIEELVDAALSFGGVISGEHGIGLEKRRFMHKAVKPRVIEIMKDIKKVLDPNNILNPGKIWGEGTLDDGK